MRPLEVLPGNIPNMFDRQSTEGPYGIGDLQLNGVAPVPGQPGTYRLIISS